MKVLEVNNLRKEYPSFTLNNICFSIEQGHIVGLIGRNGAGKSTAIKGILNLIQTTGEIKYFERNFRENESWAKEKLGYVSGGFRHYPLKKLSVISKAFSMFYPNWNQQKFEHFLKIFNLDINKKVSELSEGMKVKFSIALALSHNAELLIMDEPTSGMDPLSREEFCDILLNLVAEENISVLFSTHITTDLERVADDVIYISEGKVLVQDSLENLLKNYQIALFKSEADAKNCEDVIGLKKIKNGFEALVKSSSKISNATLEPATLDSVMIHLEIENKK